MNAIEKRLIFKFSHKKSNEIDRSAALPDAVPFLERAEKNCPQPNQEPGLNYCKGLYEWYSGNPNNALRFFNNARRSTEWGQQAICFMIEICLNPDNVIN